MWETPVSKLMKENSEPRNRLKNGGKHEALIKHDEGDRSEGNDGEHE